MGVGHTGTGELPILRQYFTGTGVLNSIGNPIGHIPSHGDNLVTVTLFCQPIHKALGMCQSFFVAHRAFCGAGKATVRLWNRLVYRVAADGGGYFIDDPVPCECTHPNRLVATSGDLVTVEDGVPDGVVVLPAQFPLEDGGVGPDWNRSQPLVWLSSFVPVPAGTRPSSILSI